MYNFDSYGHGHESSYSRNAEKKIIDCLLHEPFFRKTELHRLIATYPNAHANDKNTIIVRIMKLIWEKNHSFDTFRAFDHFLSIPKRGHFIHQFEVFLLGMNIILVAIKNGCDLKKYFGFESIPQITYCWLFTSAVHDFGYPVESFDKIIGKLSELYSEFELHKLSDLLNQLKIVKALEIEPEFSKILLPDMANRDSATISDVGTVVFNEVCDSLGVSASDDGIKELQNRLVEESNHGYVSAILLYKSVVKAMETHEFAENPWMYEAVKKAIAAVCLHSLKIDDKTDDSYFIEKISFARNPYAYLLFLVDNIQDWNRSGFPDIGGKWAEYFLDRFSADSTQIILSYRINHERWNDDDLTLVEGFLKYKKIMLEKIAPHPDKLNIEIKLNFATNLGDEFESINIMI